MEHDEDERNVNPPNARDPRQDIVGEAQSEDDGVGPEAASGSGQSAESRVPPAELPPREADASSGHSGSPETSEAPEEIAPPLEATQMQSDGQVTRIELPAELDISPTTRPPVTTGDRHSHLLPFDRGEKSEGQPNPVDQIFPPTWRLPVDSGGSLHTPEPAAADGPPEDRGETIPRVQVLVTLLESQTMFAEAIDEALEKNAPKYRQIAESEVQQGFWNYENQRRAADWRLRGP